MRDGTKHSDLWYDGFGEHTAGVQSNIRRPLPNGTGNEQTYKNEYTCTKKVTDVNKTNDNYIFSFSLHVSVPAALIRSHKRPKNIHYSRHTSSNLNGKMQKTKNKAHPLQTSPTGL